MELASATINQQGKRPSQTYHGHWLFVRFYSFISLTRVCSRVRKVFFCELFIYKKEMCMYGSLAAVNQELNITQMWLYLLASPNVSGHTRSEVAFLVGEYFCHLSEKLSSKIYCMRSDFGRGLAFYFWDDFCWIVNIPPGSTNWHFFSVGNLTN